MSALVHHPDVPQEAPTPPYRYLQVRFPIEIYNRIRTLAFERETSRQAIILEAVERALKSSSKGGR
ncbi:MAG TPA: hypothetical protein VKX25_19540 [Bryobacteraceae bacterium]|jgi:hypothetical protein|nr:hypothetical protein [Bryobacteraceae bacterium]